MDIHQAEPEGDISYLKEQQWEANFATAVVAERPLRPSVPGFATVMAPNDGGAIILAPEDGYFAGVNIAKAGMTVAAGDVLGFLVPRLGAGRDWGDALVALQRARSELELSDRELQRVTGLVAQGAVPERRLHEARQAHAIAVKAIACSGLPSVSVAGCRSGLQNISPVICLLQAVCGWSFPVPAP